MYSLLIQYDNICYTIIFATHLLLSEPPPPLPLTSPLPERAVGKACAVPKDDGGGDLSSAARLADGWHTHVRDLELQSPIWLRLWCWSGGPRQWRHPWASAEGIGPGVSRQQHPGHGRPAATQVNRACLSLCNRPKSTGANHKVPKK